MWRVIRKRLCSLQEMDKQMIDCLVIWHDQQSFIACPEQ